MDKAWRGALLVAATLLFAACGGDGAGPEEPQESYTVAFLRAVAQGEQGQALLLGELRAQSFVQGTNLEILAGDGREAHPDPEDATAQVRSWLDGGVDLIIASSSGGAAVAHETAPEVPVLFISNDPTAVGLISNEEQPESQLTGVTFRVPADRTLDIARRALGKLRSVGFIYLDADPAAGPHRTAVLEAAEELGMRVESAPFKDESGVEQAIDDLVRKGVEAIFLANSPGTIGALGAIEPAAVAAGLPLIANTDVATHAVIVLTPDTLELNRQLGRQAARLLGGSDVADVPVEDPAHFRIVLDLTVAQELGLKIPGSVIREADEVIGSS
jgi:putative ABC transport system substrate-binding protein